jgi:hypothetical protein
MQTQTEEQVRVSSCWPPVTHIHDKRDGTLKEGKLALCGAKLMGIALPLGSATCKKCQEIYLREVGL